MDNWEIVFSKYVSYNEDSGWWTISFNLKFYASAGQKVAFYIKYDSPGAFIYTTDGESSNEDVTIETGNILQEQRGNSLPLDLGSSAFTGRIKYDYAGSGSCIEDSNAIIFGRVVPGYTLRGTCSQLSSLPKYIDMVCSLDPRGKAEMYSPILQCPQTCGSGNIIESPTTRILGMIEKDGEPVVYERTCGWLSKQTERLIRIACNLDFSIWDKYNASNKCCETCA